MKKNNSVILVFFYEWDEWGAEKNVCMMNGCGCWSMLTVYRLWCSDNTLASNLIMNLITLLSCIVTFLDCNANIFWCIVTAPVCVLTQNVHIVPFCTSKSEMLTIQAHIITFQFSIFQFFSHQSFSFSLPTVPSFIPLSHLFVYLSNAPPCSLTISQYVHSATWHLLFYNSFHLPFWQSHTFVSHVSHSVSLCLDFLLFPFPCLTLPLFSPYLFLGLLYPSSCVVLPSQGRANAPPGPSTSQQQPPYALPLSRSNLFSLLYSALPDMAVESGKCSIFPEMLPTRFFPPTFPLNIHHDPCTFPV